VNRITGAALVGMVAGVLVASAIGGATRRRPHTVLGAGLGLAVGGAGEGLYLFILAFWPVLLAAAVLVLAAMVRMAWVTIAPRSALPPEIPEDYEPWDT
jgi:ABC-type Na+ efflux pump permease subunit